jgi:multidrug resistance efflux pump
MNNQKEIENLERQIERQEIKVENIEMRISWSGDQVTLKEELEKEENELRRLKDLFCELI